MRPADGVAAREYRLRPWRRRVRRPRHDRTSPHQEVVRFTNKAQPVPPIERRQVVFGWDCVYFRV
jgi:hypothetical protein